MLEAELMEQELLEAELEREVVSVGGTSDYNVLSNKPQINSVELIGNKSLEDLGIDLSGIEEEIDNVREVAEGKTKSFTVDTLASLGTVLGIDTATVADEYTIPSTTITYKEQSIELKQGDLFLIVDTSVPDYWVSVDDMKIYKMETTKVDLTDYVKKTDYATSEKAGVLKLESGTGIWKNSNNALYIACATNDEINEKKQAYKPIVPKYLDEAVRAGMTNSDLEWSDEQKTKAQKLLGVDETYIKKTGDTLQGELAIGVNRGIKTGLGGGTFFFGEYGRNILGWDYNLSNGATSPALLIGSSDQHINLILFGELPYINGSLDYVKTIVKEGITNNTIELTEEEKAQVKNWLGISGNAPVVALTPLEDGSYSLDITTTDTISEALDRINGEVI